MQSKELQIKSPAFQHAGNIPVKFSCEGEDISPALRFTGIPDQAITLVLIVEDPDAPNGTFDHWLVWNIPPVAEIPEGHRPGISGKNSAGKTGYMGPCPPRGSHRYYFHVYALDGELELPAGSSKAELLEAMRARILAQGTLMGRYEKKGQ